MQMAKLVGEYFQELLEVTRLFRSWNNHEKMGCQKSVTQPWWERKALNGDRPNAVRFALEYLRPVGACCKGDWEIRFLHFRVIHKILLPTLAVIDISYSALRRGLPFGLDPL